MSEILPLYTPGKIGITDRPLVKVFYPESDGKIEIRLNYYFPGFTITEDKRCVFKGKKYDRLKRFKEVQISGAGFLSQDKEPLLPSFGRFVQIPKGYEVVSVTYRKYHRKIFKKKFLLAWAEETVTGDGKILFDEKKYRANQFWPVNEEIVECSHPQYFYMDGYKTVLVHVRPLQYRPNKRLLRGYGKIGVTIVTAPKAKSGKKDPIESALTSHPNSLKGFSNLILNPGRNVFKHQKGTEKTTKDVTSKEGGPSFLIIFGRNLKEPAEKLKKWKNTRGLRTDTVFVERLGNTADRIKMYIRGERIKPNSSLRYVLLFGDVDKIPMSQTDEDDQCYTDHYYYTPTDAKKSECILPFVSGGRIPVKSKQEGMSVVDQIIHYEKKLDNNPECFKKITFASYFQDAFGSVGDRDDIDGRSEINCIKTMEDVRRHMVCQGFNVDRAYLSQSDNPLFYRDGSVVSQDVKREVITDEGKVTDLIIQYMDEGQLIMAQTGHGNKEEWDKPPLRLEDLKSVKAKRGGVLFSICCSTGSFQFGSKDPCFARDLLTKKGAVVSVIAANKKSPRWRNDTLLKALFDALWPGVLPRFPEGNVGYPVISQRLGDILDYAKAYLLVKHGYNKTNDIDSNNLTKKQIEIYHVIGDPTLEIR